MKIIAIPILICFIVNPVFAENYRWTDENGIVNFSDTPPSSTITASNVISIPKVDHVDSTSVRDRVEELNQATKMLRELRAVKLGIAPEDLIPRKKLSNVKNGPVTMSYNDRVKLDNLNRRMRHISVSNHSASLLQLDAARTEIAAIHSKYGLYSDVYPPAPVVTSVIVNHNGLHRVLNSNEGNFFQTIASH